MKRFILVILTGCLLFPAYAQVSKEDKGLLTIDRIFLNREFTGEYFGRTRWLNDDSGYIIFSASQEYEGAYDLVKVDLKTGKKETILNAKDLIPEGKEKPLRIENYMWSPDEKNMLIYTNSARVWRYNTRGDYWILDLSNKKLVQLGERLPESSLMFAKFSPDGKKAAYVSKHNIYVESLDNHSIKQLTFDGSDDIINGTFDWVYEEEFNCRDGFRWSPDSKKIAYWKLDASEVRDFYMINYTDSLYSYIIPVEYPKAGQTLSACKVGVIPAEGGETVWAKTKGDPQNNYIPYMEWAANSNELLIQYMNRNQNKDMVLMANANNGEIKELFAEKDDAWLDVVEDIKWLPDGSSFTWISERTGWKHIYLYSRDGKEVKAITKGNFDVISIVKIDEQKGYIYYIASPDNATQRYLYKVKMDGKSNTEKLSPQDMEGTHQYDISPNANYAIHYFSSIETPPITEVIELPSHKPIKVLVSNEELKEKYDKLKKKPVEFFKVRTTDNVTMDGFMIKPYDFDPTKKYPVLFYVYTEPAGQTVLDRWGGSGYLWHLMLAQKGYIIVSVDNRGTPAPKGREWRKSIYRKIGILNSHDQAMAAKEIMKWPFVDPDRIAIWGWSGGGSATLNAMFRYPEIYKTGMAVAPVGDIHLYDAIYQERYCGLPQGHPEEYNASSPVNFAKNLEGNLLMVHGTGDDNVHYQGTERVINELIKHNKQFSIMVYPNRSHGIYEGENTTRHLRTLLTNYLLQHTEAGGK